MIPYSIEQINESSFEFATSQGIVYSCSFFDYGFLFSDYPEFSSDVYTFNLEVLTGNSQEQPVDMRIGATVVTVLQRFFATKQNVVIYICDTTSERHLSRKRKFDLWFWKYNDGSILKEDGLAVISDTELYNSLLVHSENKLSDRIISAFRTLNERASEK